MFDCQQDLNILKFDSTIYIFVSEYLHHVQEIIFIIHILNITNIINKFAQSNSEGISVMITMFNLK